MREGRSRMSRPCGRSSGLRFLLVMMIMPVVVVRGVVVPMPVAVMIVMTVLVVVMPAVVMVILDCPLFGARFAGLYLDFARLIFQVPVR